MSYLFDDGEHQPKPGDLGAGGGRVGGVAFLPLADAGNQGSVEHLGNGHLKHLVVLRNKLGKFPVRLVRRFSQRVVRLLIPPVVKRQRRQPPPKNNCQRIMLTIRVVGILRRTIKADPNQRNQRGPRCSRVFCNRPYFRIKTKQE